MYPIPSRTAPLRSRGCALLLVVATVATLGVSRDLIAQQPGPAPAPAAQSKPAAKPAPKPQLKILPAVAPENSHLWIRVHGMSELHGKLISHPLGLAFADLLGSGRPLAQALTDLGTRFSSFATGHGMSREVLFRAFGNETQLCIYPNGHLQEALLVVRLGEHAPSFAVLLESLPVAPKDPSVRPIPNPFDAASSLYAAIEGSTLLVATSPAAVATGKSLLTPGKGLAASPDLRALWTAEKAPENDKNERSAWLSVFVRPLEAWRASGLTQGTPLARFLMDSGLSQVNAVLLRSTFDDDDFREDYGLLLGKEGGFPLEFIGQKAPDPALARLVPPQCTNWLAANIAPKGMLSFLRRGRVVLPGIGRLDALEADLKPAANLQGLDDLAGLFNGDMVLLGGNGESGPHAVVLTIADAFRLQSVLGQLGRKVELPGGNQDIHQFVVERAGGTLHLAVCDDSLIAAVDEASLAALLEQYLSGTDELRVRQAFDSAGKNAWCVGREDPRARLFATDPANERGLRPLANHLDLSAFQVLRTGQLVHLEATGTTGLSHLLFIAFDGLASSLGKSGPSAELAVLEVVEKLRLGQAVFLARGILDRDTDKVGEPGSLRDLVTYKLFVPGTDVTVETPEILAGHGYRMSLLVPADVQQAEKVHAFLAWPSQPGVTGRSSFVVMRDGTIHEHPWVPSLDPQTGPTLAQIFEQSKLGGATVAGWVTRSTSPVDAEAALAQQQAVLTAVADDVVQAHALLEVSRRKNDIDAIRRHIEHVDATVQARAAQYLGDLKDKDSVPALARLVKESPSVDVRRRAARALSLIRDPRGGKTLCEALADSDGKVRLFAATGLLGGNVPGSQKALLDAIDSHTEDVDGDRSQAVLALHDTGDPAVLEQLVATSQGGPRFQEALVYCFQQMSPKLERERETQVLVKALGSKNRSLRAYAIQRLGAAQRTEALPILVSRLETEEPALQAMLHLTIEALTPPAQRGQPDFLSQLPELADKALARFKTLPPWGRYGVALSPLVLLLGVMFLFRRRRYTTASPRARMSNVSTPLAPAETDEVAAGEPRQ